MKVYAVTGPCGVGKTTAVNSLPGNIRRHKEGYMQLDDETIYIKNSLFLSKIRYLSSWCLNMIEINSQGVKLLVSDRCPFDVAAYVSNEELQFDIVKEYMKELDQNYGITVKTVYFRASFDFSMKNVRERIVREPGRIRYGENDVIFLRKTYDFFERKISSWDFVIDSMKSKEAVKDNLLAILKP